MTAAELVAARERLGWSRERMSEEIGVLPAEASALEAGALPVARETAERVRMLVALDERDAVLRASGLPECPAFEALHAPLDAAGEAGDERAEALALEAILAHADACPVCRARRAYLEAHAPPLPAMGAWAGLLVRVNALIDRLRRPLLPHSPSGEYRRTGIFGGVVLTAVATFFIGVNIVSELLTGSAGDDSALEMVLALPVLAVAYVVGGYVAGAGWDATRRIRHRLIGYVLRGGTTAAAMYGAMGFVMPLLDEDALLFGSFLLSVGFLTVLGAMFGAGKWCKDRSMDDLPDPPDERNPA